VPFHLASPVTRNNTQVDQNKVGNTHVNQNKMDNTQVDQTSGKTKIGNMDSNGKIKAGKIQSIRSGIASNEIVVVNKML
jgi:hypothetical protein